LRLKTVEELDWIFDDGLDDMYDAQAKGGKQCFVVIKCFIERHFFGAPDASLGGVCR
jgi:hypothetical protein